MENRVKAIEVENLWYRYSGSNNWVLRGINFIIYHGETVAIVGPFGCGKTTLFRVLTGIAEKVYGGELRGEIRIYGKNLREYNAKELTKQIGILFQNPLLQFIDYVVEDDMYSFAEEYYHEREYIEKQISAVLDFFSVKKYAKKRVFELSGGELRRVAIAKLVLIKPRIILMDEPLLWLDHSGISDFIRLLNVLKELKLTIILSEHRIIPLLRFIDRLLLMDRGRIIAIKDLRSFREGGNSFKEVIGCSIERNYLEKILKTYGTKSMEKNYLRGQECYPNETCDLYIEDLWFKYNRHDKWILKGVYLKGSIGDLIVILGDNGSGKTTLLKLISGILKPVRGKIFIVGKKPFKNRNKIFFVPQIYHVSFSEETVFDELATLTCIQKNNECREKIFSILKKYGLQEKIYESPYNLSWGQQLLLNIILAVLSRRTIVLFDEPTTGLSYADKIIVAEAIRKMNALRIVVTHDIDFATLLRPNKLYVLHKASLKPLNTEHFIENNMLLVKNTYDFLRKILGKKIVGDIDVLNSP